MLLLMQPQDIRWRRILCPHPPLPLRLQGGPPPVEGVPSRPMVSISSPSSCSPVEPVSGQQQAGGLSLAGPATGQAMSPSLAGPATGQAGSFSPTEPAPDEPVSCSQVSGLAMGQLMTSSPEEEAGCAAVRSPRRFSTQVCRGLPTASKAVSEPSSPHHASSRGASRLSCTPDPSSRGASRLSSAVAATSSENGPRWSVSGSLRKQQVRKKQEADSPSS